MRWDRPKSGNQMIFCNFTRNLKLVMDNAREIENVWILFGLMIPTFVVKLVIFCKNIIQPVTVLKNQNSQSLFSIILYLSIQLKILFFFLKSIMAGLF